MASITKQPNGRRMIQFAGPDSKRRSIRLGKISQRNAEAVKVKVEQLAAAAISEHAIDADTSRWVASLDTVMAEKLANAGLIPRRESATLAAFIDGYTLSRTDVKPATQRKYKSTRRNMLAFFGDNRNLRDITPGDADDWRRSFISNGTAENTIRKHTAVAKLFFNAAVRKQILTSNPFADLKATIIPNPSRFYFVSRSEAEKVIEACPDAQWRLLFALCRYGGLRCPSETLLLRWIDINWEHGRMLVRSPKTEHHIGGVSRLVPIFPELKPHLEESFDLAEPGTEHVIMRYRDTNMNLQTQLQRIINRAGLQSWPKLFQNLRSTRQTELEEIFPSHVVCSWIGNTESVAKKHYLQVTDEHFKSAAECDAASARKGSQRLASQNDETAKTPIFAGECDSLRESAKTKSGRGGTRTRTPVTDPGF